VGLKRASEELPIQVLRGALLQARRQGPVALTAPTGSGKSTQVPRWLMQLGSVLVVEPRRVACRALAARVAELEGARLGERVGYLVRDETRARADSALVFATPGVALRMAAEGQLERFATLVLDEFHERGLDLDLLLALCLARPGGPTLVVMSATVDGERVAAHLGGLHLRGEGRLFPVERRYLAGQQGPPDPRGLSERVLAALERARGDEGDVLVFLPGKGEIAALETALRGHPELEVLPLHGGLSLGQQARVFRTAARRRVVLATNVAETSLTLPRIGVVIDSGLVRRTRYHGGRGYLTLMPIARDSARQRAGRAGRLGPGVCYRLWRQDLPLDPSTPPEVYRESLIPLVLAAAACGAPSLDLPFLDPPHDYALQDARQRLRLLGALDGENGLTARGTRLFRMPLDAHLGRLLLEAEARGTLPAAVDLCAALSVRRPLFRQRPEDPDLDLREGGCDALARIRALREGQAGPHGLDAMALAEARRAAQRIRRVWGIPQDQGPPPKPDRRALAETLLGAWPDCAHVARRRRGRVAWSNGGTELALGRHSAVEAERSEALLLLESRALGKGHQRRELVITAAMPVPLAWLLGAGLGRERLCEPLLRRGQLLARVETVYARRVLRSRDVQPQGGLARQAIGKLFLRGALFGQACEEARQRHEACSLQARLQGEEPLPPLERWLELRLEELGVEQAGDLELLAPEDLLPAALPEEEQAQLNRRFPRTLAIGDARYHIRYDVPARTATLHQVAGQRKLPPPAEFLPRLPGWTLLWERKNRVRPLRRGR